MVEDPVGRRTAGAPRTGEAPPLETGDASAELTAKAYIPREGRVSHETST